VEHAFAPPGESWVRLSPQLLAQRRLVLAVSTGVLVAAAAVLLALLLGPSWAVIPVLAGIVVVAWGWWALGRNFRSWGYSERSDDLLVTHGVVVRRLAVVPYGRMQFVDVTAGPLDRAFGIATVQLHTAAASTDARIPGLLPADAARLRDQLAALGEARSAGL
jgi:uncharacterized protein